ncbi:hypothetical protein LOK49_LG10G01242 [Camellia lanceoleosa]|uniref:Uncharacterized protein n=1 Tax=Camellia lanceoleosa TaxID=1840588 RepID=A0ACC0GBQ7_9ERIC|nr:hypothetical protein LOK49_LG10G01242 [Camellia lanceoleosa]
MVGNLESKKGQLIGMKIGTSFKMKLYYNFDELLPLLSFTFVKELTLDVENVVAALQLLVKHLPQKRVYMFHQQMLIITQKGHQVEGKELPMMLIVETM